MSDKIAELMLARAIADAINPDRDRDPELIWPALTDALCAPVARIVLENLAERGWQLTRVRTHDPSGAS